MLTTCGTMRILAHFYDIRMTSSPSAVASAWQALTDVVVPSDAQERRPEQLFERWLRKESWEPRDELIPLLCVVEPEKWSKIKVDPAVAAAEASLWQLLEQESTVAGPAGCNPVDLRGWAMTAGLQLHPALDALLRYIQVSVAVADTASGEKQAPDPEREAVLGAALAVVSRWPEQCRDAHGLIDPERVASCIETRAALWFENGAVPMPRADAEALLTRWLD